MEENIEHKLVLQKKFIDWTTVFYYKGVKIAKCLDLVLKRIQKKEGHCEDSDFSGEEDQSDDIKEKSFQTEVKREARHLDSKNIKTEKRVRKQR